MSKVLSIKGNFLITKSMFHKTAEELRELDEENNIKLLRLSECLRRRNYKKIQKGGPKGQSQKSLGNME